MLKEKILEKLNNSNILSLYSRETREKVKLLLQDKIYLAEEELEDLYEQILQPFGDINNIIKKTLAGEITFSEAELEYYFTQALKFLNSNELRDLKERIYLLQLHVSTQGSALEPWVGAKEKVGDLFNLIWNHIPQSLPEGVGEDLLEVEGNLTREALYEEYLSQFQADWLYHFIELVRLEEFQRLTPLELKEQIERIQKILSKKDELLKKGAHPDTIEEIENLLNASLSQFIQERGAILRWISENNLI